MYKVSLACPPVAATIIQPKVFVWMEPSVFIDKMNFTLLSNCATFSDLSPILVLMWAASSLDRPWLYSRKVRCSSDSIYELIFVVLKTVCLYVQKNARAVSQPPWSVNGSTKPIGGGEVFTGLVTSVLSLCNICLNLSNSASKKLGFFVVRAIEMGLEHTSSKSDFVFKLEKFRFKILIGWYATHTRAVQLPLSSAFAIAGQWTESWECGWVIYSATGFSASSPGFTYWG